MAKMDKRKVVIIGLDGATFDIIKPLVAQNRLPHLSRIMKEGVHGELKSTIHPMTPQAWSTFLTGKNAGKHGIFDFTARKEDSYDIEFVNASRRSGDSLFVLLSRAGKRVGSVAVPFTFPPEKVNGFMLSGLDAPAEDKRAVYPLELYNEIIRNVGNYYIHLSSPVGRRLDDDKLLKDMVTEDKNRTNVSKYLMTKYPCDLFMVVYNNVDRIQHQVLSEEDFENIKNKRFNDESLLVKVYQNTDREMGRLLSELDDETVVIVMSDHGAGPIKRIFFLNKWLEDIGLLSCKRVRKSYIFSITKQVRFLAKRYLPRWAKNLMKSKMYALRDKMESYLDFSGIDWEKTKAYGFGMYGNIHINLQGREPQGIVKPGKEYEDVRDEIISKLLGLRDPDAGNKIVERVYKREELYRGSFVGKAPDLLIKWKDYCYYTSNKFNTEERSYFGTFLNIDSSEYKHVGTHRLNGIFMAMGPVIKKGIQIEDASIVDLAPTILYFLGQSIPEDMDGRILNEIFSKGFLIHNPPEFSHAESESQRDITSYSKEEIQKVRERLKALGYIE